MRAASASGLHRNQLVAVSRDLEPSNHQMLTLLHRHLRGLKHQLPVHHKPRFSNITAKISSVVLKIQQPTSLASTVMSTAIMPTNVQRRMFQRLNLSHMVPSSDPRALLKAQADSKPPNRRKAMDVVVSTTLPLRRPTHHLMW